MFDVIVREGRVYDGTGNRWMEVGLGIAGRRIVAVGNLNAAKGGTGEVLGDTGGDRENNRHESTAGRNSTTQLDLQLEGLDPWHS